MAKRPAATPKATNSLRERLTDATRKLIVDAMVEQLVDSGAFDFSMFELARRANVSVRTIYRHFPTRESLFDALSARVNEEIGFQEYPETMDGAMALARRLFPSFDAHAPLIIAQLETRKGRAFRSHARQGRTAAIARAIQNAAPDVDEATRRACTAAVACLMSSDTWKRMRDDMGLDGVACGEAVAWAIEALKKKLESEQKKAKQR